MKVEPALTIVSAVVMLGAKMATSAATEC